MKGAGKPTSRDVAAQAGVSQTTVSYVMSGRRPVADESRRKVLAAMEKLGYSPDASARALRSRRARVLGVVVPYRVGADSAAQHRLIVALARRARLHDYDLVLLTTDEGVSGLRRAINTGLCAGLLIMEVVDDDPRAAVLHDRRISSGFIGLPQTDGPVFSIDGDYERAGEEGVELLIRRGHGRIDLVEPDDDSVSGLGFIGRFRDGASRAAARGSVELRLRRVGPGLPGALESLRGARCVQERAYLLGPLVSVDDWINALGLLGVRAGRDVSVLASAWDSEHPHCLVKPAYFEMGNQRLAEAAVDMLVGLVEGDGEPPITTLVPPRLMVGDSLVPEPGKWPEGEPFPRGGGLAAGVVASAEVRSDPGGGIDDDGLKE